MQAKGLYSTCVLYIHGGVVGMSWSEQNWFGESWNVWEREMLKSELNCIRSRLSKLEEDLTILEQDLRREIENIKTVLENIESKLGK